VKQRFSLPRRLYCTTTAPEVEMTPILQEKLIFYALRQPVPITLRELYSFGENITPNTHLLTAKFLHNELPVRFAQRIRDIKRLPFGLAETPSMVAVRKCYETSFHRVDSHPDIRTHEDEQSFRQMIHDIKGNHKTIQQQIATSLRELIMASKSEQADRFDFGRFLDSFYMSRLSIRMLTGQYMALQEPKDGMIGLIKLQCSPGEIAMDAARDAASLAKYYYGDAPEVEVLGAADLTFTYIPSHLHYIFFELLKNSMRATLEKHDTASRLPKIQVVIAEGEDEIAVKISDEGGGLKRDGLPRIWTYTYTTANNAITEGNTHTAPMAGFGHGLPLSRLYCRYWGGDLTMMSMEGFGTDAYVHIHKLGNRDERLPY